MHGRIARARARRNLSQAELAERLGVSQAKMVNWESGYHKVRREILLDIAEALGVSFAWLAGGGQRILYENRLCEVVESSIDPNGGRFYTLDHPALGFVDVAPLAESA
jgi:transcriptional regulator with XRE-family HTH domain